MLEFAAGIGTGIMLALWTGHLARRKASREQREIAALAEAMTRAVFAAHDEAVLIVMDPPTFAAGRRDVIERWQDKRDRRDMATLHYYAALKGEP